MNYRFVHKIVRQICREFNDWNVTCYPTEDVSWEFNICEQMFVKYLSHTHKRKTGIRFVITPTENDKIEIYISDIVVMKSRRKKGIGTEIIKRLFKSIGTKNIEFVDLIDISHGFWDVIKKRFKKIKWMIS